MSDEYPDQGADSEDQDLYSERTVAGGPPTADPRVDSADPAAADSADPAAADSADPAAADPPPTGDDRVDAAVAGLSRLAGTPPDGHVAVLEEVHGRLRDILGELDETPDTSEEPEQQ